MTKQLKIHQSIFDAISFLPLSDRRKIIDAVMMHTFEKDYVCELDGHNLAVVDLIVQLVDALETVVYYTGEGK